MGLLKCDNAVVCGTQKKTKEVEIGCVVLLHRELAVGTLRGILKQAKISPEEFMAKL